MGVGVVEPLLNLEELSLIAPVSRQVALDVRDNLTVQLGQAVNSTAVQVNAAARDEFPLKNVVDSSYAEAALADACFTIDLHQPEGSRSYQKRLNQLLPLHLIADHPAGRDGQRLLVLEGWLPRAKLPVDGVGVVLVARVQLEGTSVTKLGCDVMLSLGEAVTDSGIFDPQVRVERGGEGG